LSLVLKSPFQYPRTLILRTDKTQFKLQSNIRISRIEGGEVKGNYKLDLGKQVGYLKKTCIDMDRVGGKQK